MCMKNSPMYQPGAIGFTISNGVPKVGQLLNSAWDLTDTCRFKIITVSSANIASSIPTPSSLTSSDLKDLVEKGGKGNNCSRLNIFSSKNKNLNPKKYLASNSGTSNVNVAKSSTGGNNKETADRLDMPPPPSPASSTCSDTGTGSVNSHKRAKRAAPKEDSDPKKDEEQWLLK